MLWDEATIICGVQIKCYGEDAVDEVYWDEAPVGIPICNSCKTYLTEPEKTATLNE